VNRKTEFDTSQVGLRAFLKDYEEEAMRILWKKTEGLNSRDVWAKVNEVLGVNAISRASIINFLEYMRETGVLKGVDRTGKGGHHWIYVPTMNEAQFKAYLANNLIENLLKSFPEETKQVLKRYI